MFIADTTGEYEYNRREDWKHFVESVTEAVESGCCHNFQNCLDLRKVAYHTGGDIADCEAACLEAGLIS